MTVSLDSPLSGGAGEGRQRLQRAAARAVGFIGKMARNPLTAIGGGIIFLLLVVAIFAPLIAPYNPLVQDLNSALVAPNAQHWFGTDEFGRDIFSRTVYGSRITLYIVLLVSVTVGPLGLLLGVSAGYFGGKVDMVLMRVTDIFISFPSLVLALAFVAALGPGLEHVVIAITLTAWPPIARLARAETLSAPCRFYLRRASAGRFIVPRPLAPYRAAVSALGHYPYHHEYGRDHSDRGRSRLSRARRAAAGAGVGSDDLQRAHLYDGVLVGRNHSGAGDSDQQLSVQLLRRWPT